MCSLLALSVSVLCCLSVHSKLLFYLSPGNSDAPTGFFGGDVRAAAPSVGNFTRFQKTCARSSTKLYRDDSFNVQSVSYDRKRGKVSLHLLDVQTRSHTLLVGPACAVGRGCPKNASATARFQTPLSQVESATRDGASVAIGPFAIHDGTTYFMGLQLGSPSATGQRSWKISVNELLCTSTKSPSKLDEKCSKLIGQKKGEAEQVILYDSLHILDRSGKRGFLAVVEIINSTRYAWLIEISAKSTRKLHSYSLVESLNEFSLSQLGGIDFRSSTLCWSAKDTVFCAGYDGKVLKNAREVLPKKRSGICSAVGADKVMATVVTGIAILETAPLKFYFGCYGQANSHGGAGFVSGDDVTAVRDTSGRAVYAGSMFVADSCKTSNSGSTREFSRERFVPKLLLWVFASRHFGLSLAYSQ